MDNSFLMSNEKDTNSLCSRIFDSSKLKDTGLLTKEQWKQEHYRMLRKHDDLKMVHNMHLFTDKTIYSLLFPDSLKYELSIDKKSAKKTIHLFQEVKDSYIVYSVTNNCKNMFEFDIELFNISEQISRIDCLKYLVEDDHTKLTFASNSEEILKNYRIKIETWRSILKKVYQEYDNNCDFSNTQPNYYYELLR